MRNRFFSILIAITAGAGVGELVAQRNFAASDLATSTSTWRPAIAVALGARVRYAGQTNSPRVRSGFYLSTDSQITSRDRLLAGVETPILSRTGGTFVHRVNIVTPSNLPNARCFVGFFVDDRNQVSELSERDNTASKQILCRNRADLIVDKLEVESTGHRAGSKIRVRTQIKNVGSVTSGRFTFGLLLSTDAKASPSDILIGALRQNPVGVNGISTVVRDYNIPGHLPSRLYQLILVADVDGEVLELSETNNEKAKAVSIAGLPLGAASINYVLRRSTEKQNRSIKLRTFDSTKGGTADIAVVDTLTPNGFYLCFWTCTPNVRVDACTDLSISLLNTSVFNSWFGRLDSRGFGFARFAMPAARGFELNAYTHFASIKSNLALFRVTGAVETRITR